MGRPRFPCKHHSAKLSTKKCYFCKEYICSECQIHFIHHIFCSIWCIVKYFIKNYLKILIFPFKSKRSRDLSFVINLIVILQVILFLILYFKIQDIDDEVIKIQSEIRTPEFTKLDTSQLGFTLDTCFSPASNFINISGVSYDNTLAGLWHNGKFVQSQIVQNGKYKFLPQPLSLGMNRFALWILVEDKACLIDSFSVYYHSYRLAMLAKSVSHIKTNDKVVAFTFDAGSHIIGADSILNILKKTNIKSTFFLTGLFIKRYPTMVKKLLNDNHELANHTFSHPHLTSFEKNGLQHTLTKVNREFIQNQLNKTDSILYSKFNIHLKPYWRAPFGELNKDILSWAAELGYRHIRWSVGCDTWDWVSDENSSIYRTPEEMYQHFMKLESAGKLHGSIILMHLGTDRKSDYPFTMLSKLFKSLSKKGYKFLTISQLLRINL